MTEPTRHPVLIVDDEPDILYSLCSLLDPEFEVHTAGSASEGQAVMESRPIHVVMSDQRMPEMSGIDLLGLIRSRFPMTVRLLFTGYADIRAVIDAINVGHVYRYITKPWDPDQLIAVLRQACERYRHITEVHRLLNDMRRAHAQQLALFEALKEGRYGFLSPLGRAEAARLVGSGRALLDSLDLVLVTIREKPPSD